MRELEEARAGVQKIEEKLAEREHVVAEQDKRIGERERRAAEEEKKNAGAEFRLSEQKQTVAKEAEAGAARERSLIEREGKIAGREREVETLKARFAEQAFRVSERESALEKTERALSEREASLNAESQRIAAAERGLAKQEQAAQSREKAVAESEQRMTRRQKEIAGAEEKFAARERAVAELEAKGAAREKQIAAREEKLTSAAAKTDGQQRTLSEREQGIQKREQELQAARNELARREAEIGEKQASQAAAVQGARDELTRTREELEQRDQKLRAAEASMRERHAELRRQTDELERSRAGVAEQAKTLAASTGDAHHGSAIFAGRAEQIQIELGEAKARSAATETELAQARREMARLVEELRTLTAAAAKAKSASRSEIESRETRVAELEAQLESAKQAASEASPERIAERDAMIAELRGQLEDAQTAASAGAGGDVSAELTKRNQAIELLKQRLDEAEFKTAELTQELAAARCGKAVGADDQPERREERNGSALRRERLQRYKSLLQGQARKIVTAQNALQKRHTDCEQLLAQRARLAGVAGDIARREKRLESAKARSGAAAAVLYVVATLAILAVISWQITRQVWPGTYIATAVLEADTHGRQPNPTELTTWQNYHTELLENPSLIEMAADRMARRGLAQVGSPAELKSKLKTDMFHQSSAPGALTVELRNEGAEKARLILDTFITALKSVSDAQRDQRPDDLGVTIAQAATTGATPLSDDMLERAGMILGVGALAAGLLGMGIWSRLARAKHKFEHAQAVEAALNDVDWSAMEQSFKKLTAAGPGGEAEKGQRAEKKRKRAA
jgi:chromosome segregation ATPase